MIKEYKKEIVIGSIIAFLIFLAVKGYNVVPLIIMIGFAVSVYFLAETKGLTKALAVPANEGRANLKMSFDDIGGQNAAIKELKEALDFIIHYKEIAKLGIRPLKGILLTGPPGTGKTLMAKAAAAYTDAVFIAASGSEFIEMYAGIGAQRVRKLFKSARDMALKKGKKNAVIFIDEIDVLGGTRGRHSSHMEYDQTLNQLLVEMDGIKTDDTVKILLIAATNRVDMLDPALLRPGRFDRQVRVDLPDKDGRQQILAIHTKNKPLASDVCLETIAKETFGFSGAQLESLANEAAIYALREGKDEITFNHFKEAIDKVIMGEKIDRRPSDEELKRVAVHEVGHALISEIMKPGSVSTLTITPRGSALGYMRQAPEDDTYLYTQDYLEKQICIALAGAVAEELVLGNRSTGAANDFEQSIRIAKKMVTSGMSELGVVSEESLPRGEMYRVISGILKRMEDIVKEKTVGYKEQILKSVELLLEHERLTGDQFRKIMFFKNGEMDEAV